LSQAITIREDSDVHQESQAIHMPERATLIHIGEGPTDSRTSLALPPDLLEQVRKRVRILALLLLAAFAFDLVFAVGTVISLLLTGGSVSAALVEDGTLFYLGNVVAVAASLVLWWAAGNRRVSPSRLLTLGLGYEILVCFIIAIAALWGHYREMGFLPNVTWVPVVVILFPVLLPGPPRIAIGLQWRPQRSRSCSRTSVPGLSTGWVARWLPRAGREAINWKNCWGRAGWERYGALDTVCWPGLLPSNSLSKI
jgi:hypothetical protein